MPTLTEKIQQTLDQIAVVQAQGEQLDSEIKKLVQEATHKQQHHDALAEQFRHLQTRLATLREIAEPETHDAQQIPSPEDLIALKGTVPPEVFEQVKNVLADIPSQAHEGHQPKGEETKPEPPKNAHPSLKRKKK